jgi:hypothetical protein
MAPRHFPLWHDGKKEKEEEFISAQGTPTRRSRTVVPRLKERRKKKKKRKE